MEDEFLNFRTKKRTGLYHTLSSTWNTARGQTVRKIDFPFPIFKKKNFLVYFKNGSEIFFIFEYII